MVVSLGWWTKSLRFWKRLEFHKLINFHLFFWMLLSESEQVYQQRSVPLIRVWGAKIRPIFGGSRTPKKPRSCLSAKKNVGKIHEGFFRFSQPSTGWWFQIFFIFTPTWGRFPFWLIFFKGVETTNQSRFWFWRCSCPGFFGWVATQKHQDHQSIAEKNDGIFHPSCFFLCFRIVYGGRMTYT